MQKFYKLKLQQFIMEFVNLANIFEKLERTSKRLEKIIILRDFFTENKKITPLIFDLIAGNYKRENNKRSIGISIKTIFSVISFISSKNESEIEKYFNKIGDVGKVAEHFLKNHNKQKSLSSKPLTFEEIIKSFKTISQNSGTNKNKIKKEILTNLFLFAKSDLEYKFLARILIDELRIGVSEGVLREAFVNALFPQIIHIQIMCSKCHYINLNSKKCLRCSQELNDKNQDKLVSKRYKIKETKKDENLLKQLNTILKLNPKTNIIKTDNPRELYNLFLSLFEKKYNTINSFVSVYSELENDLRKVIKTQITIGNPIKSMLGVRSNSISQSFDICKKPALLDFKYDGLRIQIHNDCKKIKLFSRNLDEITKQFPEIISFIKNNFSDTSFILDCECVGFDFNKMEFLPFQILSRRILTKNTDHVSHIKVVVKAFDIFYINGKTIIDEPYEKRRELLEGLFINRTLKQETNLNTKTLNKLLNQL